MENLPSGYTRLSYIESHGTEYIDTEFMPNQDTRAVFSIMFGGIPSEDAGCFGSRNNYQVEQFSLVFRRTGELRFEYGNESPIAGILSVDNYYFIDMNKNSIVINGNSTNALYTAFQVKYPILLFGIIDESSIYTTSVITRMMRCKIYDNGTLVRNFVPCKNSSGECGLYDLVEDKFHQNVGTGSFTGG